MLKRLSFPLIFILAYLLMVPHLTMACSGYPYFSMEDLPEMDLLVRATVIDADDRGFNAVIRIEEYYKGEGPRLLTVMRYNVGLATGRMVRSYDTGCLYAGRGHMWRKGSTGYFGLRQNLYQTHTDAYYGSAHFYVWDGQITYQDGATEGYAMEWDAPKSISEEDFIAKLLEAGGRDEPVAPTIEGLQRYPLMRYLLITTENGARYQVNPDRSVTPIDDETAITVSPDGAHVVVRADDDTLAFYYVWDMGYTPEVIERMIQRPGKRALFSNDSNMVLVWDESHLAVYLYRNEGPGNQGDWGDGMALRLVARADLQSADGQLAHVAWSADSSTIAWQDDTGIWRWDLYEDALPRHVYEASGSDGSRLLDLSSRGRYLRYGSPAEWTLFDSQTERTYVNALPSPNENVLIFVKDESAPIDDWRNQHECAPPLTQNCAVHLNANPASDVHVFGYQMELLGLIDCRYLCDISGDSWQLAINSGPSGVRFLGGRYIESSMTDLRQIAYDPFYQQPAVLRGDYQIEFDFYASRTFEDEDNLPYLDYLNLEGIVDSPIVAIEWGQPVFYDSFMLTATEFMPRTVTIAGGATAPPGEVSEA